MTYLKAKDVTIIFIIYKYINIYFTWFMNIVHEYGPVSACGHTFERVTRFINKS